MARLNIERQNDLQPKRIQYAKEKLAELGYEIIEENTSQIMFIHKGSRVVFYPYSGWHTGKTIADGRGLDNLLQQLKCS